MLWLVRVVGGCDVVRERLHDAGGDSLERQLEEAFTARLAGRFEYERLLDRGVGVRCGFYQLPACQCRSVLRASSSRAHIGVADFLRATGVVVPQAVRSAQRRRRQVA